MIGYDEKTIADRVSENTYWYIRGGIDQVETKEQEIEMLDICRHFFDVRKVTDMNGDVAYWAIR